MHVTAARRQITRCLPHVKANDPSRPLCAPGGQPAPLAVTLEKSVHTSRPIRMQPRGPSEGALPSCLPRYGAMAINALHRQGPTVASMPASLTSHSQQPLWRAGHHKLGTIILRHTWPIESSRNPQPPESVKHRSHRSACSTVGPQKGRTPSCTPRTGNGHQTPTTAVARYAAAKHAKRRARTYFGPPRSAKQ